MSSPHSNLRTENLTLRPAIPSDAASLAALFANPLNTLHEPHKPSSPIAKEYQSRIVKWDHLRARGQAYFLVITHRRPPPPSTTTTDGKTGPGGSASPSPSAADAARVIGFGGINGISTDARGKRIADLGVLIDSSEWRKGYGREALQATIDFAFRKVEEVEGAGCDEVFFETLAVNILFQGLADRMGMAKWRKVKNGGMEVEYRFSKEDWEKMKNEEWKLCEQAY